ncbi:MAG: hypothetical protein AAF591_10580 [Verrucomicrobiota bacterium]
MANFSDKARAFLSWMPLKVMFVLVVLCLLLRENFPFSHFPMYSSFSRHSYYVYVADANNEPIPIEGITSIRTSALKKTYQGKLAEVREDLEAQGVEINGFHFMTPEQCRPAGEYTLRWLIENCKEHARPELYRHRPLNFHVVGLRYEDREIVEAPAHIATVE